jgi:hypothetical protein
MVLGDPSGDEWSGDERVASTSGQENAPTPVAEKEKQQQTQGWGLSDVFLLGIRSMGRAVLLSGKVVEAVSSEAQAAMGRYVQVRPCSSRVWLSLQTMSLGC